ncbi:pitrilysin family protein [Raineyella sp.]|uniref:M16 family metallopeptidase n=1 Tax=Raineyella sp. TaxID=1911550 RepID=UPI002B21DDDB|nr:pitrilysin family protein [Raineyella sp.]MEA5154703.1 pitrilysin family protein [Raineyella sp.]
MSYDFLRRPPRPRPAPAAPPVWRAPLPAERVLDNGMRVVVHQLPGQHVVSGALVIDLPLATEPRRLEGVATIGARCLDEGTGPHPGTAFAEELARQGAVLSLSVAQAGIRLFLDVPITHLDGALALFAEAVTRPALASADIERHIALRLAELDQVLSRPASFTSLLLRAVVFDEHSRAQRPAGGTRQTLTRISPDDVRTFHARHVDPARATLVLGGDFTGTDPVALVEAAFGGWTGIGLPPAAHPAPGAAARSVVLADRPGAVQTDVAFGGPAPDRKDPRWADLRVATHAVGGAFWSRLNRVLREERGYTYGISMGLLPFRAGGTYSVTSSFRTEVAPAAVVQARDLMSLQTAPLTADEVTDAVAYASGLLPLRLATARGVVDQTASNVLNGLSLGYVNDHLERMRAVTPASATAAYGEVVDPGTMSLVLAGDADALAGPLAEAGIVPDRVVRPEDVVG